MRRFYLQKRGLKDPLDEAHQPICGIYLSPLL
ncbi:MAG: hypothetical protein ACI9TY_000728 [Alphaproteobacteria bacterium]|jgi:hypothetical protein